MSRNAWKPLYLFNIYRLIISAFFVISFLLDIMPSFISQQDKQTFILISFLYFGLGLFFNHTIRQRWLGFNLQVISQVLVDIIIITLLMHFSGGLNSGLGMLLVVAIAGGSLLTEGRIVFFFAAAASIAILVHVTLIHVYQWNIDSSYTHAGMLGISFFATAFLAHSLAKRVRISEALAEERGRNVKYLSQLNEEIVQHIQAGIIVVDNSPKRKIQLFNSTAQILLVWPNSVTPGQELASLSPELLNELNQWFISKNEHAYLFHPIKSEVDLLANFTLLSRAGKVGTLIVLQDATLTAQKAQQLKLASLGRLTSSIAHEIRNPLDAIYRCGQMLAESPAIQASEDIKLINIIANNTRKVNRLIENILQFSRRGQVRTQLIDLDAWLHEFVEQFMLEKHLPPSALQLEIHNQHCKIGFDAVQLYQVITNICENAIRYTEQSCPALKISLHSNPESNRVYLDIRDYGSGINHEDVHKIFEPFFTTEAHGTGLGLYIAKEICEANLAGLHLQENTEQGCCFRLIFAEFNS
jgi:two-component system, NtrC family, sensor histidine kinase PilS